MPDEKNVNESNSLGTKSSSLIYGMTDELTREDENVKNIVQQTILGTKFKLGSRMDGKPIDYFKELNFADTFGEFLLKNKNASRDDKKEKISSADFKKYMESDTMVDINSILGADADRIISMNNYRIMHKNIPECSIALETYKVNIMSPDDFTKSSFSARFKNEIDKQMEDRVRLQIRELTDRYELEKISDEIVEETLKLGETYVAVLSLENEMKYLLANQPQFRTRLNEGLSFASIDPGCVNYNVLSEDIVLSEEEKTLISENYNVDISGTERKIAEIVNEAVKIGSPKDLLIERLQADNSMDINSLGFIPGAGLGPKKKKQTVKKENDAPLYIGGSSIKILPPERVVELSVDGICFGYYYAEDTGNIVGNAPYLGPQTGRELHNQPSIASNNTLAGNGTTYSYNPSAQNAGLLNGGDQKLKLLSDVFVSAIAKKVDRAFIKKNKKFKDFIYSLMKQDYLINKGIKLTYFAPSEVIKFQSPSIYRNITFFAKLYLSVLVDDILVKLGRRHDKRIFYVNVGADANYEQAIQKVIQDIKTKDYKMDNLNDFNTILNLNPGRWDDYFMPTINGERPIDIETLAGMDTDMNNEFMDYLKTSMMNGMGVPRNLIDANIELDFARTLSAQNSNFLRSVIRYQKDIGAGLSKLMQALYRNEYCFVEGKKIELEEVMAIENIEVFFNCPAALNMSNIAEQIQVVDQNAEFIATQYVPQTEIEGQEELRQSLKKEIVRDMIPAIDWEKYDSIFEKIKLKSIQEKTKEKELNKILNPDPSDYGNY